MLMLGSRFDQRLKTGPRVGVRTRDPVRAAALAALVAATGHEVVSEHDADLLLTDRPLPVSLPCLVISDRVEDFTGSQLPSAVSAAQLEAALRAVAAGLTVRLKPSQQNTIAARSALTPREAEILSCLSKGLSNKSVARTLGISQHTVKFHLEAVFAKLRATSRVEAVANGVRAGLIEL